jgi:hypothetical protein
MIVLTNPVSSGTALARAFDERTSDTLRIYTPELVPADHGDRTLVHQDLEETWLTLARAGASHVVAASEYGVTLADELNDRLGLPGNDPLLSGARRDKYLMIRAINEARVPIGNAVIVQSIAEMTAALDGCEFPIMVKPVDSAGSDGCRVCPDRLAAHRAGAALLGNRNLLGRNNDRVLLQEYFSGPQYVVNTVSIGGTHLLSDYYHCRIDEVEEGAPVYRHMRAPQLLDDRDHDVIRYTLRCLDALGIKEGAAHSEVRMTSNGPRMVEVNSRVMGPCLEPDPYFAALGTTHQHATAERYLDPEAFRARFEMPYRARKHLAKVFLRAHSEGTIAAVPGLAALRRLPNLHTVVGVPSAGTTVRDRLLTTGFTGIAFLVDDDGDRLTESLATIHDLENAGQLFDIVPDDRLDRKA